MQYSIVNLSEVKENSDFRIDAECYYLYNKGIEIKIKNMKYINFIDIIEKFNSGKNLKQEKFGKIFIKTQNIQDIIINNSIFHTNGKIDFLEYGDLIFTRVGEGVGNNSVTTNNFINSAYSDNIIRIKINTLNPFFVSAFFNIKKVQDYFKKFFKGTARHLISKENFKKILIPVFSEYFQNYIEKLIYYANEKIQSADTLYKEAEEILLEELGLKNYQPQNKKCFVKMLSDTQEAGRIDAEYFQPKYEDVIDKIKKYNGGHDILENISEIKKCIEPGSSEYKEDGIPFVRVSNLDKFGLNAKNQQYISEAFYKKNIEHQPQKGEILLSKDGSLGIAYCLYHEPKQMICSGGIVRLIENKIEPLCLALVLNSIICQMQIEKTSGGALIAHWLVDDIKNLIVPLLPQSIQSKISAKIQQSFESREKSKQLLEVAKRAVEIAIEENEEAGLKYIEENK